MANMMFFVSIVVIIASLQRTHGVEYSVTNRAATTPGGIRFTNEIGDKYSRQALISATDFIWQIFQQTSETDRKNVSQVSLTIETVDGVSYVSNNKIHVSEGYIEGYVGDIKTEITGVLYHEMTHVWQWDGRGPNQTPIPIGLFEGIADFVRLKANYAPSSWVQPRQGDRWDQGYDVTAHFLDYCDNVRSGFVAELNKKTRSGYSDDYFVDLTGKTVDQLWSDYKTKHNTNYEIVCLIE